MKKVNSLFALAFLLLSSLQLQAQKDQRTINTKIADVLAQMPAKDENALQTAMREMETLGEEGLIALTTKLVPEGKADNSRLEYAIMGYTAYVSGKGKDALKNTTESAWSKSLQKLKDKNHTAFMLNMLEIIGTDNAVDFVVPFLKDDQLSKKASVTLASIGTQKAGKALLSALVETAGSKTNLLQALGNMKYREAVKQITPYVASTNEEEKEAALYALAEIADPSSANVWSAQMSGNNDPFGNRFATAQYARYIQNLNDGGDKETASKLIGGFFKKSSRSNTFARTAALRLLASAKKENALKELVNAAFDKDPAYAAAALEFAAPYMGERQAQLYTKKLGRATPEAQQAVVQFLGYQKQQSALPAIIKLAKDSKDPLVRRAAITAMAQIGGKEVVPALFNILSKGESYDMASVKQAFLLLNEPGLSGKIAAQASAFEGEAKAVLLDVLSARRAADAFPIVAREVSSSDANVKKSALLALSNVSNAKALPDLFSMLTSANNDEEIAVLQKSVIAALQEVATNRERESLVLDKMKESGADKAALFFPILNSIGSVNTLDVVFKAYQNSKGATKDKAFKALTSWPNVNAMNALYSIAKDDVGARQKDAALTGYISLIKRSAAPQEQKLLFLKKAMEAATTSGQKNRILSETAAITTFPALAFAAKYLDDKDTKQSAAAAVMNIGLSDKAYYGSLVREWLTRAMNALDGQDAIYMKKSIQKFLDDMPAGEGYVSLFNGKDLAGWKGLVGNPISRAKMSQEALAEAQSKADEVMRNGWIVKDGELIFTGKGDNIATAKKYDDIELQLDWKIYDEGHKEGDAGVYLRGTPQVQMWDTSRVNVGAQVGSGGLYNNQKYESKPLKVADNQLGEWNHFFIRMVGDKVTVYLNGELVTDNVPLENYWDRKMPLFPEEQIELQAHGSRVAYRDIYVKELSSENANELTNEEKEDGFQSLFNGTNLSEWTGNTTDYVVEGNELAVKPQPGSRGNLYSRNEYGDFIFRFEFKLTPGANNGLGIRAPMEGDAAYTGMEIQILDNEADMYKNLEKYQYHGSVYGVIPAKRGYLKPVGEWNEQEVRVQGPKIKVTLNGTVILDGDLTEARKKGTLDKKEHPGIFRDKGHLAFLGHGSIVYFRNMRIKEL